MINKANISSKMQNWKMFVSLIKDPKTSLKIIYMTILGLCSGIPLYLVYSTLSAWLRDEGVSRTEIGYFLWVGLAYSFKFLWAPIIDHVPAPGVEKWMGRRKGWVIFSQIFIVFGVLGLAYSNPSKSLGFTALAAIFTAFWGATQDVAIDAWRIEVSKENDSGFLVAAYQAGYRIAYFGAIVFAFLIADFASWKIAYLVVLLFFICASIITAIFAPGPERVKQAHINPDLQPAMTDKTVKGAHFNQIFKSVSQTVKTAIILPFSSFWKRYHLIAILAILLISSYRITDYVLGVMANPFYIDLGLSKTQIAASIKTFGPIFTLLGAFCAGLGLSFFGLKILLIIGAILGAFSNLAYAWLAYKAQALGIDVISIKYVVYALIIENFSGGLAGTVLIAFMSSLTEKRFAATQYAFFSSMYAFSGKLIGGWSGQIVDFFANSEIQNYMILLIPEFGSEKIAHQFSSSSFTIYYSITPKLSGYAPFFIISGIIGLGAVILSVLWYFIAPQIKLE